MVYKKKDRLSRRAARNLYLKGARSFSEAKNPLSRRASRPGQHGAKPPRYTEYGKQLREKQTVKEIYLLREKRFKNLFKQAMAIAEKTKANKGHLFLQLLERMLFIMIYRAGLAKSKSAARQIVVHGHVKVNGRRVKSPTYLLKQGDVVEISPKVFDKVKPDYDFPYVADWLEVNGNKFKVLRYPERSEIRQDIDESLVVAWYTR